MKELSQADLNNVFGAGRTTYADICGVAGTYGMFAGAMMGSITGGVSTNAASGVVVYGVLGGMAGAAIGGFILPAVIYGSYTAIRNANLYLSTE